jgi:hypothetical protein
MPGSFTAAVTSPRPLSLAVRLLVVAALVLYLVQLLEKAMVEPLVPMYRSVIGLLDQQFVITDARIGRDRGSEVVMFRANLRGPTRFAGRVLYPFGSNGMPAGEYQASCTLGGVLLYSSLLVILALSWPARCVQPARRVRELAVRLLISLAFAGLLLLIDVPTTVVAELRHAAETLVDPHALSGWMIWSRFLMGGGGIALSILLAALAIAVGRRYSRSPADRDDPVAGSGDQHETHRKHRVRPERQWTISRN